MPAEQNRLTVENTTRHVVEDQLLTALNDKGKVAILATHEDLKLMIQAMDALQTTGVAVAAAQFAADLKQLERSAFP